MGFFVENYTKDYLHTKNQKTQLYLLGLELVYFLNGNTSKMQCIISWSINSLKRRQNKGKVNIVSLSSSEQDEEKVQSAGKKEFLEKATYSK